jgi:DNA-binding MarR family transcriptional regulator
MNPPRRSVQKHEEPDLAILSARFLWAFQRELFERLAEQGHPEVRPRHGPVLAFLDRDGTRAADLARISGRPKQLITTLVDELVELGYVEREPDPADGRAKLVVPTEHGLDEMRRADAIIRSIEARVADQIGAEALAKAKEALRVAAADQPPQTAR